MSNINKEVIILNGISIILVIVVAFLAGMEGILDEFQFHQPLVACTLIGLVTGQLIPCIILGGTLQMIALGWANIGAAVAPDGAFASVAAASILVQGGQRRNGGILLLKMPISERWNSGRLLPSACRDFALPSPLQRFVLYLRQLFRDFLNPCLHGSRTAWQSAAVWL